MDLEQALTLVSNCGCRRLYQREVRNLDGSWFVQFIGKDSAGGVDLPDQVFIGKEAAMKWLDNAL